MKVRLLILLLTLSLVACNGEVNLAALIGFDLQFSPEDLERMVSPFCGGMPPPCG